MSYDCPEPAASPERLTIACASTLKQRRSGLFDFGYSPNRPRRLAHNGHKHRDPRPTPPHPPRLASPRAADLPRVHTDAMAAPLQFATFTSEIELPFYSTLFASKLDYDKLDDSARLVLGLYEPRAEEPDSSCKMQILGNALTSQQCVFRIHR